MGALDGPDFSITSSVLTFKCADRPGIAAAVIGAVADAGGNVANADQHTDTVSGLFLQRVEVDEGCDWQKLDATLPAIAERFGADWHIHHPGPPPRVVVACSAQLHCAADLILRAALGELRIDVAAVVSDKDAAADLARRHDITFHHVPVGEDRAAQESALRTTLRELDGDLVVLARYMRILPAPIAEDWWPRMINIHHAFLPAFVGARPYQQAHERGVKIIGATAHYVTAELDQGPIIAQDTLRVTHRDEVADLTRKGRDVERIVLAEAVRLHIEHRVLVFGNRTCVFA